MSFLGKKYGIEAEKIQALVKDGWINCNLTRDEQIVYIYQESIKKGKSRPQAISDAAEYGRVSDRQVYTILHKFE